MRTDTLWKVATLLAAAAAPYPATAQDAGLARCSALPDDKARLACFDTLSRERAAAKPPVVAPQASAAAGSAAAPAPAEREKARRAKFGLSAIRLQAQRPAEEAAPERLTAVVTSASPFGAGYWTIATQDGQVWRVTEARRSFRPPSPGDTVVLRRASMGSFLLVAAGQPGIRAQRIS